MPRLTRWRVHAAAAAVLGLAAAGGTACNCDSETMHARSAPAAPGVAYPDTCLRGPRGAADFDAQFWRTAPLSVAPDSALSCSATAPASTRGTYVLVDRDHADYRSPQGEVEHLEPIGPTMLSTCG